MLPALTAALDTLRETVDAVVWVVLVITALLAYRPRPSLGDQIIVVLLALVLGALTRRRRIKREEEARRMRSGAAALQLTELLIDGKQVPARTYGWLTPHRRPARDCETHPHRSEAMIQLATTDLMARRLTGETTISWHDLTSPDQIRIPG